MPDPFEPLFADAAARGEAPGEPGEQEFDIAATGGEGAGKTHVAVLGNRFGNGQLPRSVLNG